MNINKTQHDSIVLKVRSFLFADTWLKEKVSDLVAIVESEVMTAYEEGYTDAQSLELKQKQRTCLMGHLGKPCTCAGKRGITMWYECTKCGKPTDMVNDNDKENALYHSNDTEGKRCTIDYHIGEIVNGGGCSACQPMQKASNLRKPTVVNKANEVVSKVVKQTEWWKDNGDWKDQELDSIWHHGIEELAKGNIDKYELLNCIEAQIEKLLKRKLTLFAKRKDMYIQQAITLATSRHQVVGRKETLYIELEQLEKILEGKL